jgi:hypothetical protein
MSTALTILARGAEEQEQLRRHHDEVGRPSRTIAAVELIVGLFVGIEQRDRRSLVLGDFVLVAHGGSNPWHARGHRENRCRICSRLSIRVLSVFVRSSQRKLVEKAVRDPVPKRFRGGTHVIEGGWRLGVRTGKRSLPGAAAVHGRLQQRVARAVAEWSRIL